MDLLQLRYFQTVATTGNMSKAADILYVSQPNLSISVTRLEEDLGVQLFDRRRGKIVLNENGKRFLASVNQALSILDTAACAIKKQASEKTTLSLAFMSDEHRLLKEFVAAYPDVNICCQNLNQAAVVNALHNHEIDLAMMTIEPFDNQIGFEKVYEGEFALLVSDAHPLAAKKKVAYSDLADEELVMDSTLVDIDLFRNSTLKRGLTPLIRHEIHQLPLVIELVQSGRFLSSLPSIKYKELSLHSEADGVLCKQFVERSPTAYMGVAWNQNTPLSKAGLLFLSFARDYFHRIEEDYARLHPDAPPSL